jgi:hypothetical protein
MEDHFLNGKRVARYRTYLSDEHKCHYKGALRTTVDGEEVLGHARLSNCKGVGMKGLISSTCALYLPPSRCIPDE